MAVYTVLEREEIAEFVSAYGVGPLQDYAPIADGIENSNYFVQTDASKCDGEDTEALAGAYVLTIFEELSPAELGDYHRLTTLLHEHAIPCPYPLRDVDGRTWREVEGRPASLTPRLPGTHPNAPTPEQCAQMGAALGRIHAATLGSALDFEGRRSWRWLREIASQVRPHLGAEEQALMDGLTGTLMPKLESASLPRAVIHGDLFKDNALFDRGQLSGVLDFYSAGTGFLLFDLAVTVNDWCSDATGALMTEHADALVAAYHAQRPLTSAEREHWNSMLRVAAGRFWISRLYLRHVPSSHRPGALVASRDPSRYRAILDRRCSQG